MEEDNNTMHRYRDSLVVRHNGPYERAAFGAYVLFPWYDEDGYEEHKLYKSINEVNIGGLPFLPNATRLVEQFIERLIEKSPEELQKEGILPRGTIEEWQSSLDEKVLVGMVPREQNYRAHLQHCFYHIPVKRLKKEWQEAKYIALCPKKRAAPVNGVTCYGKIVDVKFVKRFEINELPKNSFEEYVKFEIESWYFFKEHCETSWIWEIGLYDDNVKHITRSKRATRIIYEVQRGNHFVENAQETVRSNSV